MATLFAMKYFPFTIKKSFELWTVNFSSAKDCKQLVCKLQVDTDSSYGQDNANPLKATCA